MITGPWLEFKQEPKIVTLKFKTPAHIWNICSIKFSEAVSRRVDIVNTQPEKLQSLHIVHETTSLFQHQIIHYGTIKHCHISVWRTRLGKDKARSSSAPWPHISVLQYKSFRSHAIQHYGRAISVFLLHTYWNCTSAFTYTCLYLFKQQFFIYSLSGGSVRR